jgi:hypothetical protein
MKFFRVWLDFQIMDIAFNGTKEEMKAEMDRLHPGILPRVEEFEWKNWEVIRTEERVKSWN